MDCTLDWSIDKNIKKTKIKLYIQTPFPRIPMPKIYVGLSQKQIDLLEKICEKRGMSKIQELIRFLINDLIEKELEEEKEKKINR